MRPAAQCCDQAEEGEPHHQLKPQFEIVAIDRPRTARGKISAISGQKTGPSPIAKNARLVATAAAMIQASAPDAPKTKLTASASRLAAIDRRADNVHDAAAGIDGRLHEPANSRQRALL